MSEERRQSAMHFYVAKYMKGDFKLLESVCDVLESLARNGALKSFGTDLVTSAGLLTQEMNIPNYRDRLKDEINISKITLACCGSFKEFIGFRTYKSITNKQIIPSYNSLLGKDVTCVVENGILVHKMEGVEITHKEMTSQVQEAFIKREVDTVVFNEREPMLVSEVAKIEYSMVKGLDVAEVSCENKGNVKMVIDSVARLREDVISGAFSSVLKDNMSTMAPDVKLKVNKNGKDTMVSYVFPTILEYFLDPLHRLNSQDIPRVMIRDYGFEHTNITAEERKLNFSLAYERGFEGLPYFLFSDSWIVENLDDSAKFNNFVPVYTGYHAAPFVMVRTDFQFKWRDMKYMRGCMNVLRKVAKILGIWMRAGLLPSVFKKYLCSVCVLKSSNPMSAAIISSLDLWMRRYEITEYIEGSVLKKSDESILEFTTGDVPFSLEGLMDDLGPLLIDKRVVISGGEGSNIVNNPDIIITPIEEVLDLVGDFYDPDKS